ncbi:MAG: hypothetical protein M3O71_03780 [Bacteroidota bacterium]|nr:hypothetical protein [Bacteroidota bacterium]
MIRRLAVSIMLLLYFITATGFAVNLHYCCNTLAAVSINAPAKSCDSTMGAMKCCKDRHFEVKVKDAHQVQATSNLAKAPVLAVPVIPAAPHFRTRPHLLICNATKNRPDPPPPNKTPKFLRQLLI